MRERESGKHLDLVRNKVKSSTLNIDDDDDDVQSHKIVVIF